MGKKKQPRKRQPGKRIDRSRQEEYDYHLPVLLKESVDYLVRDPEGTYIDGTLGGGGHTAEILRRLGKKGRIISFDKDEAAIAHCRARFREELDKRNESRLLIVNDCFSGLKSLKNHRGDTQGVLLDLGLSSRQLDDSRRGFSYRTNSRIDMRFGSSGRSAEELLNAAEEDEIVKILREYGEEPFALKIARRITQIRRVTPLSYTFDLKAAVIDSVPRHMVNKSLSRVFQALRIAVNNELEVLKDALDGSLEVLAPGGRIVIISYHSLEDRIVKNFFRDNSRLSKNANTNDEKANTMPKLKILTKKPVVPDNDEKLRNPRSRSAKMRVAEILE